MFIDDNFEFKSGKFSSKNNVHLRGIKIEKCKLGRMNCLDVKKALLHE